MPRSVSKPHLAHRSAPIHPNHFGTERRRRRRQKAKGPGSACRTGMVTAAAAMAASALSNTRTSSVCAWTRVRGQCSGDRHCARISPGLRLRRLHSPLLGRCLVVALLDLPRERTSTHTKSVLPRPHVHTSTFTLPRCTCTPRCASTPRHHARRRAALRDRWLKPPRSMAQTSEIDGSKCHRVLLYRGLRDLDVDRFGREDL